MKTTNVFLLLIALFFATVSAQDYSTRTMKMRFNNNGHEYSVRDFISYEMNKMYLTKKESIRDSILQRTEAQQGVSGVAVWPPDNISSIKFSAGTSGKGKLELFINDIVNNFDYGGARFDTKINLKITADLEVVSVDNIYKLKVTNTIAETSTPQMTHCHSDVPYYCEYLWSLIVWHWALTGFPDVTEKINDTTYDLLNLSRIPSGLTAEKIQEAINSFPMQFSLSGGTNDDLVINIDFLKTSVNGTLNFENIIPATVTDPTFEHLGFNLSSGSLYHAFDTYSSGNRPFTTTGETGNTDQRNFILQGMKNYLGRTVSFYFHWGDIAVDQNGSTLLVNGSFDPATLTPGPSGPLETKIAELYANGTWQKSTDVLAELHTNEFDVVATVGTPGVIKDGTGSGIMAPDRSIRGKNGDYFYVDKNTYLYYLKIFAHAVVRKYKDQIGVWLIQPELNASKFAYWIGFGKKYGNCWDEQGNTNDKFQWQMWRTWVDAVRAEDPTAKVSTALHMLNMEYGLETFGPDCDIISFNLYPNEMFATPVLGFAVGEMTWAVRRALKGLGMENKPVWITETNYPAVPWHAADNEPPVNTSLDSLRVYYSYGRQATYMNDALETAAQNGAKGFFWWHFLDSEAGYPPFAYTGYGSLIIGNSNPPQFKVLAVTAFQTKSNVKHFGKSQVTLTNKSTSNPNLGDAIGIYAERDNLSSGTSVHINKNRKHISQTYSQILSGQKHQNWSTNSVSSQSEFRLKENFTPLLPTVPRDALFAATNSISLKTVVNNGEATTTSTLNYLDPWWVDANGNQNVSRDISLTPTFTDNVFLAQNPTFDPTKPYYSISAPLTQTINGFASNFQNWSGTNVIFENANAQSTGVVFSTAGATVTANYKAFHVSNQIDAYDNPSQRRVVRAPSMLPLFPNGILQLVYESDGKIYYEISTDNGVTWKINWLNNGESGKNPSIALLSGSYFAIVCEEDQPDYGRKKIKLMAGEIGNIYSIGYVKDKNGADVIICQWPNQNIDPVITANPVSGKFVVAWKQEYINGYSLGGLYAMHGKFDAQVWCGAPITWNGTYNPYPQPIAGTNSSSCNPTLNTFVSPAADSFALAWEQRTGTTNSHIYYTKMKWNTDALTFEQVQNISSLSGYTYNENPSFITYPDLTARIAWKGRRETIPEEMAKTNAVSQQRVSLFKSTDYYRYWSFGQEVASPHINKSSNRYIVAWSENNGAVNKYTDNRTLSTISTLNSIGDNLQVTNGETANNMFVTSYQSQGASPHRFYTSNNIGSFGKVKQSSVANGREGVVGRGNTQIYFALGDISVDGVFVKFKPIEDSVVFSSLSTVNKYLITEPFVLTPSAQFFFGIECGIADTTNIMEAFSANTQVRFKVELIDASTQNIIGSYDDVKFSLSSLLPYKNIAYCVNTDGSNNSTVQLRLTVEAPSGYEFSIKDKIADISVLGLGKESGRRTVISYRGQLAVTTYALSQNYPNPFNPTTMINYALPKAGNVVLKIYDVLGKEVATLVNNYKESGRYSVEFDASKLSSGMYIYKLTSGSFSEVKKMLLLR